MSPSDNGQHYGEFFDDIAWWVKFMNMFNGTVKFLLLKPITCLQTDACLQGGAGYYEGDFFYVNWDIDLPQFKNYQHFYYLHLINYRLNA
jgi:hypothetical protein